LIDSGFKEISDVFENQSAVCLARFLKSMTVRAVWGWRWRRCSEQPMSHSLHPEWYYWRRGPPLLCPQI